MAHRAIDAYKKTKSKVLILTFNITLCHYIRDVINQLRHRDPEFKDTKNFMRNFRIQHFHLFIKLFAIEHEIIKNKKKANTYDIIETDVKEFEKYKGYYKTILVDEIQDYEREWVDIIRALADENTELIFWGDEEQNIYNRLQDKEGMHKHRCYTGIRGNWNRIHGSHRVQGNIANLALSFQKVFLYDYDDNRIEPTMDDLFMPETHVEYHFLDNMATEIIFDEVDRFVKKYKIHQDDICYLSNIVAPVREIEAELNKRGYRTITTFETEAEYQALSQKYQSDEYIKEKLENIRRAAKFRFEMESGKIKLATIHSYKGWGINTEVLIISNNSNEHITPQLIYTAITRAVSNLLIFSIGSNKYHEFFNYAIPKMEACPKYSNYVKKDLSQKIQLLKQKNSQIKSKKFSSDIYIPEKEEKIEGKLKDPTLHQISQNNVTNSLNKISANNNTSLSVCKDQDFSIDADTRRVMAELAKEYNSNYYYTDGKKLRLERSYAKKIAFSGRSFISQNEAKKIPLIEVIVNYSYLAIEAKENYYYLVPCKGFKFTIRHIQILAYDQFFECELLTEQYNFTIRLKEPAIVEKREDKYYLVRKGFLLFSGK